MEIFETILVMLALILASNILQRFLPFIAVPIIQIVLGGLFFAHFTAHLLRTFA
ncbi:sodium/hydrogen exchanger family protein [Brochothrix campestris FSL F6-1037]|uniref:Sodium/hydrogen exchanger family protein n=1 Tax=Brochothrix campestris FSL F6-1037 TaxID=1265861 RepID=W7CJZ2_9LIST|nr:sodium/hydrogen exchanger family protein [Brochothrix campestris FSL F6-1037]